MWRANGLLLCVAILFSLRVAPAHAFEWGTSDSASEGMSAQKLAKLTDDLQAHNTRAFLVIRHDKIVCEWYAPGSGPEKPQGTASLAKAMVGGMSLAVAMQDGRMKPEDLACKWVAQWKSDSRKSKITVGQLATHSSGLDDAEVDGVAHDKLTGWKGDFWKRTPDPFTISRDLTPAVFEPGQRISYSNPGMAMLSYVVTAAIADGPQKDVRSLLRERVYEPIGMKPREWSVGYGATYKVEGLDLVANWGGATFTPRAAARVGRLMLRDGDWDGKTILDPAIVKMCTEYPDVPKSGRFQGEGSPQPGFGWWSNRDGAWKSAPRDMFMGSGAGHQVLIVIPSLDLVAVRNGANFSANEVYWLAAEKNLIEPLVQCVTDPPYRPSDTIRSVKFAPAESIIRKALDSDNWPITWGDDGNLYTSYGDGEGFEPFVEKKLSMGIARVEGTPPDFKGVNIRAASAERTGNGAKGPKASGMLMVDGVLYMWVRNTANATLAWSADHGKNWTWGFTFNTSFGCPTFLNFGQNYAGAGDDYIYAYSQDGPSAYEPYDRVVLARAPRSRIRERDAYEFFTGSNSSGLASWSRDITARGPVFAYPSHCERLDASYTAPLHRYLLTVSFGHGQGWGIFDSPTPWGPWTTAFFTRDWGLGDTHGYRLPTKWMSADGTSMWLVFSGREFNGVLYDAFCARRMTLDLYPHP